MDINKNFNVKLINIEITLNIHKEQKSFKELKNYDHKDGFVEFTCKLFLKTNS